MLSKIPLCTENVESKTKDMELLRLAIVSEIDAINLYEQSAAETKSEGLAKIFLDIAKEEKTHIGEFQYLLLSLDPEQTQEIQNGAEEVTSKLEE